MLLAEHEGLRKGKRVAISWMFDFDTKVPRNDRRNRSGGSKGTLKKEAAAKAMAL